MVWSIRDKTVVITGASAGIGKAAATALAKQGARLVLVCRDRGRGEAAAAAIRGQAPDAQVELVIADLGVQADVRRAAAEILERCPRIEVLINNAGATHSARQETADGIEVTWAVNHLAYVLLTKLLLDRIKSSAPARIINVASDAHRRAQIDFEDPEGKRSWNGWRAYCQSKLANVMFTYELARRLEGSGVVAHCLHPGVIASQFALQSSGLINLFFRFARPFLLTEEQGAATTIHLATAPELSPATGGYFEKSRPGRSNRWSYDQDAQRRLWELSESMIGGTV